MLSPPPARGGSAPPTRIVAGGPTRRRRAGGAENVEALLPDYLRDLERLVNIDCGSYTKAGVDEVGRWTAGFLRDQLGAVVEIDANDKLGDTVIGRLAGDGPRALLIGHMDTVFDPGTAAERPFRIEEGIARGPGVTDMKSGLLGGLYALKALRASPGLADAAGRLAPARAADVRGQPGRGDRLARQLAGDPARGRVGGSCPGAGVRPRQRRHRQLPQGHRGPAPGHHRPGGARRGGAGEGAAARPWRRRTRPSRSTR